MKLYGIICLCGLMLCACGKNKHAAEMSAAKDDGYKDYSTEEWGAGSGDLIPMVMVDDVLYLSAGYEKEADERCDTFDGEITSQVEGSEMPTVNDQSNFGTGYGYQYGTAEGLIEIYMNDKWQVFATEKILACDTLILDE